MSRTFFTADHHWGHEGIIAQCDRPFSSVADMDEAMIGNWNAIVRPNDDVWYVGDFAHECEPKRMRWIFDQLHGRKHLIIGNHDDENTFKLPWAAPPRHMARVSVDGDRLVLNHYCMRVWPELRRGAIHLHGHSHGRLRGTSRCLDVGVDSWKFMPVDLYQIRERLAELPALDSEYLEAEIE